MIKTAILFLALALSACAQSYHIIRVTPAGTTQGEIDFCGDNSHATACQTIKANTSGTAMIGLVQSFNTRPGAVTLLAADVAAVEQDLRTSASPQFVGGTFTGALAVATGDNNYLTVDGTGNQRAGITKKSGFVPKFTHGQTTPFIISQSSAADIGSANTFTDDVSIIGGNVTARNVFNSIGDVPIAGAANTSSTTITQTSGDIFNVSMVGGNILICPGGCSGTNGSLFLVTAYISSTQLSLATSPGTLTGAGWSYQGNAFQTSQGTMYITGSGFGYMQNMVVTNGFTALSTSNLTGNVTCSGTSCVLNSGSNFNLSMQGGSIIIVATPYTVSTVDTDHSLTLTSSAGTVTGAYSYTPIGVIVKSGGIDIIGNSAFRTGINVSGGSISVTSAGSVSTASGGFNAGSGGFTGNGSLSGTHLQNLGTGDIVTFFGVIASGITVTSTGIAVTGNSTFATGINVTGGSIVNSGAGNVTVGTGKFVANGNVGVTGGTCSHWTAGICDTL